MGKRQQTDSADVKREEGFILVAVALVLLALIGFVALAVDTGVLYGARTASQEIADAAAMAGAFTFINTPSAPQPATAINHALGVATHNDVMGTPLAVGDVTVTPDLANRRVTVSIKSKQKTYFAKALGWQTADIAATATGEAARYARGSACVRPCLPNTGLSAGAVCDNECNPAHLLVDPNTKEVTAFGLSMLRSSFRTPVEQVTIAKTSPTATVHTSAVATRSP